MTPRRADPALHPIDLEGAAAPASAAYDTRVGTVLPPRVGLTSYREPAAWGAWQEQADLLAADYAIAVERAGAVPILLPPVSTRTEEAAQAAVGGLHGLLLSGGHDIDSALYGQDRHPSADEPRRERDAWELALLRNALVSGIPVLAICRGFQVLNVALGGTLVQHLPDLHGSDAHRPRLGEFCLHRVTFEPASRAGAIYGCEDEVPAHHHQGIDVLAPALVATAWADDGLVEAVEVPGEQWIIGVQWHPEAGGGDALFAAFVEEAACFRDRPAPAAGHDPAVSGTSAPA